MTAFPLKLGRKASRGGGLELTPPHPSSAGPSVSSRVPLLSELAAELYTLAFTLRRAGDLGDPAEVRRKIVSLLETFERHAREAGYSSAHCDQARFALVALLDEAILSSGWEAGKSAWRMNPLQRELYKMNVAGQEFYTRLEQLRANREENRRVLDVYHACLAMGFEGQYKLLGREKLEALIRDLSTELAGTASPRADHLSPAWKRPDDFPETVGDAVPVWTTIALFFGAVLLEIVIFAVAAGLSARGVAASLRGLLP